MTPYGNVAVMNRSLVGWLWLAVSLACVGCGATSIDAARMRFSNEYSCPESETKTEELGGSTYRMSGCGKTETYTCKAVNNPLAGHSASSIPCMKN